MGAAEIVAAGKMKIGPAEALQLARGMDRIVAVRGRSVRTLDLAADRPDDETILAHLLGPTGNLRAPTARVGRTLVVGFSEAAYREVLET